MYEKQMSILVLHCSLYKIYLYARGRSNTPTRGVWLFLGVRDFVQKLWCKFVSNQPKVILIKCSKSFKTPISLGMKNKNNQNSTSRSYWSILYSAKNQEKSSSFLPENMGKFEWNYHFYSIGWLSASLSKMSLWEDFPNFWRKWQNYSIFSSV